MQNLTPQADTMLDLLALWLSGQTTDAQFARLESILDEHHDCRRLYLEYMATHSRLQWDLGSVGSPVPDTRPLHAEPSAKPSQVAGWLRWAGAAAAVAVIAVTVWLLLPAGHQQQASDPGPSIARQPVATITAADDVVWRSEPMYAGQALDTRTVAIESGQLQFMMDNGATIHLHGDAALTIEGPMQARLTRGSALFECPPRAVGYTVKLPGDVGVIDLGTAFVVGVDAYGASEVAVLEGRVAITQPSLQATELAVGQIVRIEPGRTPTPLDAPHQSRASILAVDRPIETGFETGQLHPALQVSNPERYRITGGVLRYVGRAETRAYLRTRRGDLLDHDLRLEATFTTEPNDTDDLLARYPDGNRLFVGLGDAVPSETYFDEPAHSFGFSLVLATGNVLVQANDNGASHTLAGHSLGSPLYGTIRIRMTQRGRTLRLAIDRDPQADASAFEADHVIGPIAMPDDLPIEAGRAHAYLGTGHFGLRTDLDDYELIFNPPDQQAIQTTP